MNVLAQSLELVDKTFEVIKNFQISSNQKTLHIPYPCSDSSNCTPYLSLFPPGKYRIKACGGNGGVRSDEQVEEEKAPDTRYAAGCSEGKIKLKSFTKIYLTIGGHGSYGNSDGISRIKGGYNGGGDAGIASKYHFSSGGGATDIRADVNDVFHRILVAGGAGGGDDISGLGAFLNDGAGGSGGGLTSQGWYDNGTAVTFPVSNETFGFSFGQGEAPLYDSIDHEWLTSKPIAESDLAGAGSGWFGGFVSNHNNKGAGGGSSYALTKSSTLPSGVICRHTQFYEEIECKEYAFAEHRNYTFYDVIHQRGVWFGNGYIDITMLSLIGECTYRGLKTHSLHLYVMCFVVLK